jgi:hypothetical protein
MGDILFMCYNDGYIAGWNIKNKECYYLQNLGLASKKCGTEVTLCVWNNLLVVNNSSFGMTAFKVDDREYELRPQAADDKYRELVAHGYDGKYRCPRSVVVCWGKWLAVAYVKKLVTYDRIENDVLTGDLLAECSHDIHCMAVHDDMLYTAHINLCYHSVWVWNKRYECFKKIDIEVVHSMRFRGNNIFYVNRDGILLEYNDSTATSRKMTTFPHTSRRVHVIDDRVVTSSPLGLELWTEQFKWSEASHKNFSIKSKRIIKTLFFLHSIERKGCLIKRLARDTLRELIYFVTSY